MWSGVKSEGDEGEWEAKEGRGGEEEDGLSEV